MYCASFIPTMYNLFMLKTINNVAANRNINAGYQQTDYKLRNHNPYIFSATVRVAKLFALIKNYRETAIYHIPYY